MYKRFSFCSAFNTSFLMLALVLIFSPSLTSVAACMEYKLPVQLSGSITAVWDIPATDPLAWLAALYTGGILIMGMYHLLLFLVIRDKYPAYVYYGLYTISSGILLYCFQSAFTGSEHSSRGWPEAGIILTSLLMVYNIYKLIKESLPAVKLPKSVDKYFVRTLAGAALLNSAVYLINSKASSIICIGFLLAVCMAVTSYTPLMLQRRRLMASSIWISIFMLISLLTLAFVSSGWISMNVYTLHISYLSMLLHTIGISAVLAQRINVFTEKEKTITSQLLKAEQSQRFKDQFLANTSHEIRTPMNAILGFTRLLEQSPLDTSQQEYVRLINTSAENLLVIINDILDFSKIESGKIVLEKVNIHLDKLCHSLIETLQLRIAEKHLEVGYFIDDRIPAVLLGDPVRLNQILLNLLTNAIKFTDQGSVFLKIQLLEETAEGVHLHFEVKDTGIGIPQDKLKIIFDSFSQATDQTTRKYGGTGLGLSIVKQLVELQGGSVAVESRPQEGSTFSVYLSFGKGTGTQHVQARNVSVLNTMPNNLSILLLEDNPINQILAVNTLQKWMPDIHIDVAADGKEGISKLKEKNYDLMLVDIQMPEMDGYETTRYIRTHMDVSKKNIPIIALTAGALKEDEQKAIEAGMNDYLSKPFDIETLASKIKRLPISADRRSPGGNKFEIADVERAGLGEPDFMVQLMNMFLEKTPEALLQMEQFSATENWKGISFVAHRIKSVFACMGLPIYKKNCLL
jgi:signal transduction histidine kinase/CheY-like chemotaxis protein